MNQNPVCTPVVQWYFWPGIHVLKKSIYKLWFCGYWTDLLRGLNCLYILGSYKFLHITNGCQYFSLNIFHATPFDDHYDKTTQAYDLSS